MQQKVSKQISYWLGVVAVGLMLGLGIQFARAWTEPTLAPPGGNLEIPLNAGNIDQVKKANLTVNAGWDTNSDGLPDTASVNGLLVPFGNIGIGTSSPNNLLQVYDLINFDNTGSNTKLGYQAGRNIVAGAENNTFIGYQAGLASLTLSTNASDFNTGVGMQVLYSNTTGFDNTAIGDTALYSNTIGDSNTAVGAEALYSNTTGVYNTAHGVVALRDNTTGYDNTAIGVSALERNTTGYDNTATGAEALFLNTTGNNNTASGIATLSDNTTGNNNTVFGYNSGKGITTGSANTIIGAEVTGLAAGLSNNIIIADGSGNRRINVNNTGNVGIGTTGPTELLDVNSNNIRIRTAKTPATGSACDAGEISWDTNYIYVCVNTNTWKRSSLAAY